MGLTYLLKLVSFYLYKQQ